MPYYPPASILPVADTTALVKGSADPTKLVRLEADGLTTGTTRALTVPDANITLAGINLAQTWTATQTFTLAPVFTDASGTRAALGLGTAAVQNTGTDGVVVPLLSAANIHSGLATFLAGVLVGSGLAAGAITASPPGSGAGMGLSLSGSAAVSGNTAGGNVTLTPGVKSGSGADGLVVIKAATTAPAATLLEVQTSAGAARLLAGTGAVLAGMDAYYFAVKPGSREYRFGAFDAAGSFVFTRDDAANGLMVTPAAASVTLGPAAASTFAIVTSNAGADNIVLTPAAAGGTGVLQVGRRLSDSSAAVGASVQLWTNTGQTLPAITVLAPGGASGSLFDVMPSGLVQQSGTVTAGGTTGAQTINKPCGTVNFAAAAVSLVVTNSLVTASSIVLATVLTNDGTLKSVQAVCAAGSFTLHANAAATAETKVGWQVINVL